MMPAWCLEDADLCLVVEEAVAEAAQCKYEVSRPIKPCQLPSLLSRTGALQISLTQSTLSSSAINHFPVPNQHTLLPPPPPSIFPYCSPQLLSDSATNSLIAPGKVEHHHTMTATREQYNHWLSLPTVSNQDAIRGSFVVVLTDYTSSEPIETLVMLVAVTNGDETYRRSRRLCLGLWEYTRLQLEIIWNNVQCNCL